MFEPLQADFASALLDADRLVPSALTTHSTGAPVRRFAVYRNNVVTSLVEAMRQKFPATERIVGEEFFRAMARLFVAAHPPKTKILHEYGDDFGDFIASFRPAAALSYLPDVTRLEAARTRAYHAPDATSLAPEAFAAIDPDTVGALRLQLHPSLQVVRSRHPVVTIWHMNAAEGGVRGLDEWRPEDALVLRPQLQVCVGKLCPGGASLVCALRAGAPLAEAAARAATDRNFDLTGNLAELISSGAIVGFLASQEGVP